VDRRDGAAPFEPFFETATFLRLELRARVDNRPPWRSNQAIWRCW
jgi:hypothetical protein